MIKIALLLVIISSCKATKASTEDKKAYYVINAFLDYYIEKTNQGVFLSPLVINRKSHVIINIFDEEGKIHEDICGDHMNNINISNDDFDNYIKKQSINRWDYSSIRNKNVVKKLVLEASARIKYEKAKENRMLKRENEWITYKYMLWRNKNNVPLITLSYPFFSKDNNSAVLYMSRHNGGGYMFILKKGKSEKWQVICDKNLFQY